MIINGQMDHVEISNRLDLAKHAAWGFAASLGEGDTVSAAALGDLGWILNEVHAQFISIMKEACQAQDHNRPNKGPGGK